MRDITFKAVTIIAGATFIISAGFLDSVYYTIPLILCIISLVYFIFIGYANDWFDVDARKAVTDEYKSTNKHRNRESDNDFG